MARNVFISFLGTGNYKECIYATSIYGDSSVVKFVQLAIYELACKHFGEEDKVVVFLTDQAEKTHWHEFNKTFQQFRVSPVPVFDVPEGYSSSDFWKIFKLIFDSIEENDKIILDITHGFRSLPMLSMVLLSYAKTLKNIEINGIFYGAFEVLGPSFNIDERIPDPSHRRAPLIDLLPFSILQDWTFASKSFIDTGNFDGIQELVLHDVIPILKETKGKDLVALQLRKLITHLSKAEKELVTNRGNLISKSIHLNEVKSIIEHLIEDELSLIPPFKPLIKVILDKFNNFNSSNLEKWEAGVDWCIKHGLDQQGITQFQEGIISFFCKMYKLEENSLIIREVVSQALRIYSFNKPEEQWFSPASEHKGIVYSILSYDRIAQLSPIYDKLAELRNDINHGGYNQNAIQDPAVFTSRLSSLFSKFLSIK